MTQEEVLKALGDMACNVAEKRQKFIAWGSSALADKLCIWHIVVLEVQNIIRFTPRENAKLKLDGLGQDLSESMIYFRDNSMLNYSENYAAALDCFNRLYDVVKPYFL